jgi:hypothetical protein
VGIGSSDSKATNIIQWTMMIFGFALIAGVIFREAMLMLGGDTTTLMDNWPLLALGAIFFLGGLSCWFCPHSENSNLSNSDNDRNDL